MNKKGFGEAAVDKSSSNPDAIRGAEQQGIEANGGAQSQRGTSGNAINGISDSNPSGQGYRAAARAEFGAAEGASAAGDTIDVIVIASDLDNFP